MKGREANAGHLIGRVRLGVYYTGVGRCVKNLRTPNILPFEYKHRIVKALFISEEPGMNRRDVKSDLTEQFRSCKISTGRQVIFRLQG